MNQHTSAQARAHSDVDQWITAATSTPFGLTQSSCIYIRIKSHRHAELGLQWAYQIDMLPARFGRGGDVAISLAVLIQVHRAKAAYAYGGHRTVLTLSLLDESLHLLQRGLWFPGVDAHRGTQVQWASAYGDIDLRAACFYGSY
jgi:hypothetical protein